MGDSVVEWGSQALPEEEQAGRGYGVSLIWRRGWKLGTRIAMVGFVVSSAPFILPPIVFFSAIGLAFSVPFSLVFSGYACTDKLIRTLLPIQEVLDYGEKVKIVAQDSIEVTDIDHSETVLSFGDDLENIDDEWETIGKARADPSEIAAGYTVAVGNGEGKEECVMRIKDNDGVEVKKVNDDGSGKNCTVEVLQGEENVRTFAEDDYKTADDNRTREGAEGSEDTEVFLERYEAVVYGGMGNENATIQKEGIMRQRSVEKERENAHDNRARRGAENKRVIRECYEAVVYEGMGNENAIIHEEGIVRHNFDGGLVVDDGKEKKGNIEETKSDGHLVGLEENVWESDEDYKANTDYGRKIRKMEEVGEGNMLLITVNEKEDVDNLEGDISIVLSNDGMEDNEDGVMDIGNLEKDSLFQIGEEVLLVGREENPWTTTEDECNSSCRGIVLANEERNVVPGDSISERESALHQPLASVMWPAQPAMSQLLAVPDFVTKKEFGAEQTDSSLRNTAIVPPKMENKEPSEEVIYTEQEIWEQIKALQTIVGYKDALNANYMEELKALHLFTGVNPLPVFEELSDHIEVNKKLRFLKSIVGIR